MTITMKGKATVKQQEKKETKKGKTCLVSTH
jgi:hypothetical protein